MNKMVNSYFLFAKIVYILVFGGFVRAKKCTVHLEKICEAPSFVPMRVQLQ